MADLIRLSCPTCGAKLEITRDMDRFACANCGNEFIVRRSGGIVSLSPVVEGLTRIQTGVDKTASELAILRLEKEIATLKTQKPKAGFSGVQGCLFAILFGVPGLFFGYVLLENGALEIGVPLLVLSGLLIVTVLPAWLQESKKRRQVKWWQEVISTKQEELERHRMIVSR